MKNLKNLEIQNKDKFAEKKIIKKSGKKIYKKKKFYKKTK